MESSRSAGSIRRRRAPRLAPEERRAQLLRAALRVFARRGLGAARHAELAREAGVAVSTTFAYFPTRDALVAAVLDAVEELFVDLAERVHAAGRPAPEVLLAHARAFARTVDEHPDATRIWLAWSSAVGGEQWSRYHAFEERVNAAVARTIDRGQREGSIDARLAPREGGRIMIGAAYLIAQMKLSGRAEEEVASFLEVLVQVLAGGLMAGPLPEPGPGRSWPSPGTRAQ